MGAVQGQAQLRVLGKEGLGELAGVRLRVGAGGPAGAAAKLEYTV